MATPINLYTCLVGMSPEPPNYYTVTSQCIKAAERGKRYCKFYVAPTKEMIEMLSKEGIKCTWKSVGKAYIGATHWEGTYDYVMLSW